MVSGRWGPVGISLVLVDPTGLLRAYLCLGSPRISPRALEWSWLFLLFLDHVWGGLMWLG